MIQTGFGHSSKSNVFSNFHPEHLSNTCLLKPLLPCITLSSFLVYLSLILLSGLTQASPPYYLLRSTLSPDHLQTQVELKNFLASRDVFLHSGFCGKNNNHILVSSDTGQMACIERYPRFQQAIRGELYSYHFSQWLGTSNIPAIVVTRLRYAHDIWQPWKSKLTGMGWHEGDYLVVSHYYQNLSEVKLPEILRTKKILSPRTRGHDSMSEMYQWSNLIIQDYINGENDRLVNTLVNLEQNSSMYSHPVHNLGRSSDQRLIAYDNERSFGKGYDFALSKFDDVTGQKQQQYQPHVLYRLCLVSDSVREKLNDLSNQEDPAKTLEGYIQSVDFESFSLIAPLSKEHREVFNHRILHVLKHFSQCHRSPRINP